MIYIAIIKKIEDIQVAVMIEIVEAEAEIDTQQLDPVQNQNQDQDLVPVVAVIPQKKVQKIQNIIVKEIQEIQDINLLLQDIKQHHQKIIKIIIFLLKMKIIK